MGLLHEIGYANVLHLSDGIAGWRAGGGIIEIGEGSARAAPRVRRPADPRTRWLSAFFDRLAGQSFGALFGIWFGMVVGFGTIFWLLEAAMPGGLVDRGVPVRLDLAGLATSIYFSFVTATSVGFGDVVPAGIVRALAVAESATELLVFGLIVSKLVSGRQEHLTEEIHRIAFEDRLGRVRTNLYVVLSELQTLSNESLLERLSLDRMLQRLESVGMMLAGELRTVHDLLYRTQQVPEEPVLEAILTSLAAGLAEFCALCESLPDGRTQSAALTANSAIIGDLAYEICGECVPREYAPALQLSMDRIRDLANRMRAVAA
ncbi:MAG: two pore domain potassium channel family protein [Planctomycetes bacterium]|nr:two pore domain potassium channel family protein [Planctomycetota bacterium]MBI3847638.1 two pore domain potassium channel family protein [Planctomycetota bacterium]